MSAVAEHLYETILRALDAIPSDERDGIYVVSLLVYDEEDDPRLPTVTVGFNTEGDVAEVMATMSEFTDAREARWNYAFWRQNELAVVCDSDRDAYGAAIRGAWVQSLVGERPALPTPESDEEELQVTDAFVEALMEVVQRLHRGEVERIFGRPIPLLIHEVEYYDLIADQNLRANPPGVVPDDFVAFCRAE